MEPEPDLYTGSDQKITGSGSATLVFTEMHLLREKGGNVTKTIKS